MQSDGSNFGGDVVSDSLNMTFRDGVNILYQIYKIKYVRIIIIKILVLFNIHTKTTVALVCGTKTQFYEFLVVMCSISLDMHIILQSLLKF